MPSGASIALFRFAADTIHSPLTAWIGGVQGVRTSPFDTLISNVVQRYPIFSLPTSIDVPQADVAADDDPTSQFAQKCVGMQEESLVRIPSSAAVRTIAAITLFTALHGMRGAAADLSGRPSVQPPASFSQCRTCHGVDKAAPAGIGPSLAGIFGAQAGGRPGYDYSPAMRASKIRWDQAKLDALLSNPKALVPGTRMTIPGIKDAAKRKEIIDYLATLK